MKIQIQAQQLRWRIDENELAILLESGFVANETQWSATSGLLQCISLYAVTEKPMAAMKISPSRWELRLARETLANYVERLPCRDALTTTWNPDGLTELQILFEVDVRDSKRVRRQPTTALADSN